MSKNSILKSFIPAQYSNGKEPYVYYWALNPIKNKLERQKIKLARIKKTSERKKYAESIIRDLNAKLYNGWNPFMEESAPRGYNKLSKVIDIFQREKTKELRDDSIRSYDSFILTFKKWLIAEKKDTMYSANFNRLDALDYLNFISEKDLNNKTWNNYKSFMTILFNWIVEHEYAAENFFLKIKKKLEAPKDRIVINTVSRNKILPYLESTDYNFLIVSLLVFHALIRPKDIAHLKPMHFSLKEQTVQIMASSTKNKRFRIITIPNSLMPFLVQWNFNNAANSEYIFGKDMLPGSEPVDPRKFSKKWEKLRKDLKLDKKEQLYSLRDSGIIQMFDDGISLPEVMKQAGHQDSRVTMIYALHANKKSSEQIKKQNSSF